MQEQSRERSHRIMAQLFFIAGFVFQFFLVEEEQQLNMDYSEIAAHVFGSERQWRQPESDYRQACGFSYINRCDHFIIFA